MRVLNRIVPLEEGPAGSRRTIRKEWLSQARVKWVSKDQGTIVSKYGVKAIYGTDHVCAVVFEERSVRPYLQGQKTVRSGRTNML